MEITIDRNTDISDPIRDTLALNGPGLVKTNFSIKEIMCPCCGRAIINYKLLYSVQYLREHLGVPIYVNSWYRSDKHNKKVGGHKNSRHLYGEAADIVISGLTPEEMAEEAEASGLFAGIGIYPNKGFIHVDVGPHPVRWVDNSKSKKR